MDYLSLSRPWFGLSMTSNGRPGTGRSGISGGPLKTVTEDLQTISIMQGSFKSSKVVSRMCCLSIFNLRVIWVQGIAICAWIEQSLSDQIQREGFAEARGLLVVNCDLPKGGYLRQPAKKIVLLSGFRHMRLMKSCRLLNICKAKTLCINRIHTASWGVLSIWKIVNGMH